MQKSGQVSHLEKILVVDDEEGQRRTLSIALKYEGFRVTEAGSSEEAVEAMERMSFDAALVDVVMPGMNGLDLARKLHVDHPHVKIVLVSAYHLSKRQILQSQTGAVAFLPKPYRLASLVRFLRERVGRVDPADPVVIEA